MPCRQCGEADRIVFGIKRRLDRPGTVLVSVGAGPIVGTDGLPALMEAAGFDVRRVQ